MKMNDATLDRQIHELVVQIKEALTQRGESMATAESCTGGLVAASIVAEPGSSDILAGGIVAYRNEIKENLLGVPHDVLEQFGAVSEQTVEAMAEGALRKFGCQWAVSTSGIAGPTGAEPGKPVGFVWMCVANNHEKVAFSEIVDGNRNEIREKSVYKVLGKLNFLLNKQKSTCTNEH
jgi:nicotinamide-nucleotide amidase